MRNPTRRDFGRAAGALTAAGLTPGPSSAVSTVAAAYAVAVVDAPPATLPKGVRLPFGWRAAAVGREPVSLTFASLPSKSRATELRVGVAVGTGDERVVEVVAAGRVVGAFDVRFACPFQPYAVPLDAATVEVARQGGLTLRLARGNAPLWVFTQGRDLPDALRPHLLLPGTSDRDPLVESMDRLGSLASVQPFGWMEGCVLDGLLDLAATPGRASLADVARDHLKRFTPGGKLVYESSGSAPLDNRVYGIEGTLPFAALARLEPGHKLLDLVAEFWAKHADADGIVLDGKTLTSEGSYTVGYPMAVLGGVRKSAALDRAALTQVRARHAQLFDGKEFSRTLTGTKRGDRNWARGVAWQLLGAARTLAELRGRADITEAVAEFKLLTEWATASQRPDGLWAVFVDEPKLTADTGGSAGLAAAFAIGVKAGLLAGKHARAADLALTGLRRNLTPDGFLGGVSQANKGGTRLQRGDYRVIYPMALGLLGQLVAARG